MSNRSIVVVSAGLSQPSSTRLLADRLADATVAELAQRGITAQVETVELRDLAHEIVNMTLTGFASGPLREVLDTVERADGVIAVSPVFSASYSGLFKSFVDVLDTMLDAHPEVASIEDSALLPDMYSEVEREAAADTALYADTTALLFTDLPDEAGSSQVEKATVVAPTRSDPRFFASSSVPSARAASGIAKPAAANPAMIERR